MKFTAQGMVTPSSCSSASSESTSSRISHTQIESLVDFDFKATPWNTGQGLKTNNELELLKEKNKQAKKLKEKFPELKDEPTWLLRHIEILREDYAKHGWEYDVVIPEECQHRLYPSTIGTYLIFTRDKKGRKGKVTKEYIPVPLSNGAEWSSWKPMDDEGRPPTKYSLEDLLESDRKAEATRRKELAAYLAKEAEDAEKELDEDEIDDAEIDEYPVDEEEIDEYLVNEEEIDEYPVENPDETPSRRRVIYNSSKASRPVSNGESSVHIGSTRPTTSASHGSIITAGDYAPDRALRTRRKESTISAPSGAPNQEASSKAGKGNSSKRKPVSGSSRKNGNRQSIGWKDARERVADIDEEMEADKEYVDEEDQDDQKDYDRSLSPQPIPRNQRRSGVVHISDSDEEEGRDEDVDIKMEEDEEDFDGDDQGAQDDFGRSPPHQPISRSRSRSRSIHSSDSNAVGEEHHENDIDMEADDGYAGKYDRSDEEDHDRSPTPQQMSRKRSRARVIYSSDPDDEEEDSDEEDMPSFIPTSNKARREGASNVVDLSDSESESEDDESDDELPDFNTKSRYSKHTRATIIEISDEDEDEEEEHKNVSPESGMRKKLLRGSGPHRDNFEDQKQDFNDGYGYGDDDTAYDAEEMDDDIEDYESYREGTGHEHYLVDEEDGDEEEDALYDEEYEANELQKHEAEQDEHDHGHIIPAGDFDNYGARSDGAASNDEIMVGDAKGGGEAEDQIPDGQWFDGSAFCNSCKLHEHECLCNTGGQNNPFVIDSDEEEDCED
ncbi:hypothetical protein VTL71DRAFT_6177 [Oculimacula yallundae]|uniref:Uncharacterized protein n=1 Tax=Oculimacula yallundae TaxID=86028 RepID=A0ABR4BZK7_9HELO